MAPQSSFADFVTDDAANSSTANGANRAAARQNGAADGTDSRADGGILVLLRHAGTADQTNQHYCGNCTECESL
jgi:hypothetical protein